VSQYLSACVVYDILTGKVAMKLHEHHACVRDVSWHPYNNNLVSSSVILLTTFIHLFISGMHC